MLIKMNNTGVKGMKENSLKKNFQKFKSLSIGAVLGLALVVSAESAVQARPSYYTGLASVTPVTKEGEKFLSINFGKKIAMVTDRPVRTHKVVDPSEMVQYVNSSGDVAALVLRPSENSSLSKYELVPTGPLVIGADGVQIDTGNCIGDKKHSALWEKISGKHFNGFMTVTLLMYKGEGEKDFFITPEKMEFTAAKGGEGHASLKLVKPAVEALGIKKKGCKACQDKNGKSYTPASCIDSKHQSIKKFRKLWASKAKDSFGKDNPNGFIWATFTDKTVVMTVIIGTPKGDNLPITLLDAHVVSDQGTQHMGEEIALADIVNVLVQEKTARGVVMVDEICTSLMQAEGIC